jgi:hypothetical protein
MDPHLTQKYHTDKNASFMQFLRVHFRVFVLMTHKNKLSPRLVYASLRFTKIRNITVPYMVPVWIQVPI